jgi:hypothetical protein
MKVLICGSRGIKDLRLIARAIKESGFDVNEIISGGAGGVDSLAEGYALAKNIPIRVFKPDWKQFGSRAGIVRNAEMVKEADAVIAIWDKKSKGTKSSIDFARKENKPLYVLEIEI